MNNSKCQLFIIKNGRSGLRCAVFYHEHGLYCCEVSGDVNHESGRHGDEDGRRSDEDGLHAGNAPDLFCDIRVRHRLISVH